MSEASPSPHSVAEESARNVDRIVVFVGPSIPVDLARGILPNADYRPPIKRGDLDKVASGATVGIIDGVFDQSLSVSPSEIAEAIARGIKVMGSSSMGALRAVEVPGVVGVGGVYEMYRSGVVEDDDEVAIVFNPDSHVAMSEPLVNIRHSVQELTKTGLFDVKTARLIIKTAKKLPYRDRTYKLVLRAAGLLDQKDGPAILEALRSRDLKREDAKLLLSKIGEFARSHDAAAHRDVAFVGRHASVQARQTVDPERGEFLLWESGDHILMADLLIFMAMTGELGPHLEAVACAYAYAGNEVDPPDDDANHVTEAAQTTLNRLRMTWGWYTQEEVDVTLRDFSMNLDTVSEILGERELSRRALERLVAEQEGELWRRLRVQLLQHGLELKRELLRAASLRVLASRWTGEIAPGALAEAKQKICELMDLADWDLVLAKASELGIPASAADAFADAVARARATVLSMYTAPRSRKARRGPSPLRLRQSRKVPGSLKHCIELKTAAAHTKRLAKIMGVTRVANITGLDSVGIYVAQSFRPSRYWSTTVSGGKSTSLAGAKVAAVMEDLEAYCQERFGASAGVVEGSFDSLKTKHHIVDPLDLDLPYDSSYRPDRSLAWMWCHDILNERMILVPRDYLVLEQHADDICFSPRLATKVYSTNGLASGFTFEEALAHALCEFIERHNDHVASTLFECVRSVYELPFRAVDLSTLPPRAAKLANRCRRAGLHVRIIDITADIRVPTFSAIASADRPTQSTLYASGFRQIRGGLGCHPDPEQAIVSALFEAAQTRVGTIAGSREDINQEWRSLGRHERPMTMPHPLRRLLFGLDVPMCAFAEIEGFRTRDARQDVEWLLKRLQNDGVRQVIVADTSLPELAPARAVRVVIPGLETSATLRKGLRARAASLSDLVGPRRRLVGLPNIGQ